MTFKFAQDELDRAFRAIEYHGYSALLPLPPEWRVVQSNWNELRPELSNIDLHSYQPSLPMRVYAPKSRATVRVVNFLHPVDLLFYTAATLLVKDCLEAQRISTKKQVVFSYRADPKEPDKLYVRSDYTAFRERLRHQADAYGTKYIAIADIADFYPHIYQHRLENVISSSARTERERDCARVIAKLLSNLASKNSHGIPVGPFASRILAEAVLIDIDSFLMSNGCRFARFVDDYYLFDRSESRSQELLFSLAQRLYDYHGLTLSALKTKIVSKDGFLKKVLTRQNESIDSRIAQLQDASSRSTYDDEQTEDARLSETDAALLAEIDVSAIINQSISDRELVDYETLGTLLRHGTLLLGLSEQKRQKAADTLLEQIEHLYPLAEDLALFFRSFCDSAPRRLKHMKKGLLRSLRTTHGRWPPDYYMIWVLDIFASSDRWGPAAEYVRIFRDHRSDTVRRAAALAIARNGTRADGVEAKDRFAAASPLERLAILDASRKLGADERRHWRATLQLTGPLEKRI